jgi:NADPH:quinone reductase-like Zn-dependent oxidoreductase
MARSVRRARAAGKRAKLDETARCCHARVMDRVRAARYALTGTPAEVVACEEIPVPPPGPGEVRVRMICAPVNPADLNMLEGKYGEARPLPDTPGNEGLGEVIACGEGAEASLVGRRVLVGSEAWRDQGNWPVADLIIVPPSLDDRQACMLRVNPPTAWLLLHRFAVLDRGAWIAQNAATSGVGRAVIEIAKAAGWKTFNVVRRPEAAAELQTLGADAVAVDGPEFTEQARTLLAGVRPRLGLNAVGGAAATRLAGLLADGSPLVTYGAMSREALKVPNGFLIFRDLVFRGFWLTRWLREASAAERADVYAAVFRLAAAGAFAPRVAAEFALEHVKDAVAATASGVPGKVLLRLGD